MMTSQQTHTPLRTVIVGFGKVGAGYVEDPVMAQHYPYATHAQVLADHPAFTWEAVVDPSHTAQQMAHDRWHIPYVTTTTAELITMYAPEVAILATPPSTRLELLDRLPHLRAVLVEKPLGETHEQAARFLSECARRNIKVQVNLWRRADTLFNRLANGLLAETIGDVQAVFGLYGNGLRNNGTHLVDFVRMLFGEVQNARIVPCARIVPAGPFPDDLQVPFTLTLESGVVASLQPVDFTHYRENSLDIWGTKGRLSIQQEGLGISLYPRTDHRATQYEYEIASDSPHLLPSTVGHAFYRMYDNLAGAIFHNTPLCSPGDSALRTTRIVESLMQQARAQYIERQNHG